MQPPPAAPCTDVHFGSCPVLQVASATLHPSALQHERCSSCPLLAACHTIDNANQPVRFSRLWRCSGKWPSPSTVIVLMSGVWPAAFHLPIWIQSAWVRSSMMALCRRQRTHSVCRTSSLRLVSSQDPTSRLQLATPTSAHMTAPGGSPMLWTSGYACSSRAQLCTILWLATGRYGMYTPLF